MTSGRIRVLSQNTVKSGVDVYFWVILKGCACKDDLDTGATYTLDLMVTEVGSECI